MNTASPMNTTRVLVTGAAGKLGPAVVAEFAEAGFDVGPLTRADLDVPHDDVATAKEQLNPAVVINCTAWNDVDAAEHQPEAAFAVNRDAVRKLASACMAC